MVNDERLHQILEPLIFFSNKNLFETLNLLLIRTKSSLENSNKLCNNVYNFFCDVYNTLNSKNILENLSKADLGYFQKIKYNFIFVIELVVEVYHYFNF